MLSSLNCLHVHYAHWSCTFEESFDRHSGGARRYFFLLAAFAAIFFLWATAFLM